MRCRHLRPRTSTAKPHPLSCARALLSTWSESVTSPTSTTPYPPVCPPRARHAIFFLPSLTWDLQQAYTTRLLIPTVAAAPSSSRIYPPPHTRAWKSYAPEEIRTPPRYISLPLPRVPLGIGQHGSDTLRARRRQGNCISMPPPTPHCASCCSARQRSPASPCKDARCAIWGQQRLTRIPTEIGKWPWRVTHLRCLLDAGLANQHGRRACYSARLRR
jgi:hypothetical protein